MRFAMEEKICQGVFQFDTGSIGPSFLLSALPYIMDETVIIK